MKKSGNSPSRPRLTLAILGLIAVALTSCGKSSTPQAAAASIVPPSVLSTEGSLTLKGDLNGQKLNGAVGTLTVGKNALSGEASVTITKLDSDQGLKIPPVNNVYSSFIMGDVPGKKFAGAWHVKIDAPAFTQSARLSVNRQTTVATQALSDTITEMFMKNTLTGEVTLVGTFLNDQLLELENFGDIANEIRADDKTKSADFTLFGYTVNQVTYNNTCISEGGTTKYQACSFAEKVLPAKIGAQFVGSLQTISWNVGNVATSCGAYAYKLCYRTTERSISDKFLAFEQTSGKPDVIFLQELFNGICVGINETSWYTNTFNPRLCSPGASIVPSITRILGTNGVRYNYTCSDPVYKAGKYVNGYECVAVKVGGSINLTGKYQLHPSCDTNYDPNQNYSGFDTGVLFATAVLNGKALDLGSVHLIGTNVPDCRGFQINQIRDNVANHPVSRIVAGDFNTEPFNDNTAGGVAFRSDFSSNSYGYWATSTPGFGTIIDNAHEQTASYYGYYPSLDHVISDSFTGNCSRGGNFNGTDHFSTQCYLYSYTY